MKHLKTFENDNWTPEDIENNIIESLNLANEKLSADEFSKLAESIIDYIDEINREKRI